METFPGTGQPESPRSSKDTLRDSIFSKDYDDAMSDEFEQMESHKLLDDVEARPTLTLSQEKAHRRTPSGAALEYRIPTGTKLTYLGLYFLLNLSLTIYNKAILGSFHFPWLLTALHATSASIGCFVLLSNGVFTLTRLSPREHLVLIAFSFLFTLNIAMSNVSLALVSIPFHQITRSTTPLFAILIYKILYGRTYSTSTYLSLIPLILGVGLATYGDYYFTPLGLILTLTGTVLASIKTIATNTLMTGHLALPALEVLLRMSPLAAVQSVAFAWGSGELDRFCGYVEAGHLTAFTVLALAGNGVLAFALNISSFQTNKLAGALTITVCGNVKQCLTILLGIVLFNVKVGPLNGAGMGLAIAGAAWYSMVELRTKRKRVSASVPGSLSELLNPPPTPATPFTPGPRPLWEPGGAFAAWLVKWREGFA